MEVKTIDEMIGKQWSKVSLTSDAELIFESDTHKARFYHRQD